MYFSESESQYHNISFVFDLRIIFGPIAVQLVGPKGQHCQVPGVDCYRYGGDDDVMKMEQNVL